MNNLEKKRTINFLTMKQRTFICECITKKDLIQILKELIE